MKRVHYTKYNGDLASEIDLEDLLQALSDYLLDSGFHDPYSTLRSSIAASTTCASCFDGCLKTATPSMTPSARSSMSSPPQGKLDELIDKLLQRMEQENYISMKGPREPMQNPQAGGGSADGPNGEARFEVTDKSLDFLGFKALRDLLGSLGKSS